MRTLIRTTLFLTGSAWVLLMASLSHAAQQDPRPSPQEKESTYQEKTSRAAVASALGCAGPKGIPSLMELLKDKDPKVRSAAVESLGKMGAAAASAVPEIAALLKHKDVQLEAALALKGIGPEAKAAVPALMEFLRNEQQGKRWAAIQALAEIGPAASAAVPTLTELLNHNEFRSEAVFALEKIGPAAATAVPALVNLLNDKWEGRAAARALGKIGPDAKAAVPALAAQLGSENESARESAAEALGEIGPEAKAAIPALIESLKKEGGRRATITAFRTMGPEARAAVPALAELLNDENVGCHALETLRKIGSAARPAVPAIVALLKDRRMREDALVALGRIGADAETIVPALLPLLKDQDWTMRQGALSLLEDMGTDAKAASSVLAEIVRDHRDDRRFREIATLGLAKIDPSVVRTFVELLEEKDQRLRSIAVHLLGEIGPQARDAVPALIELFKGEKPAARVEIALTLGKIGPAAAAAIPLMRDALSGNDVLLRWAAVRALAKIDAGAKVVGPALAELLKDKNREVQQAAASALRTNPSKSKTTEAEAGRIRGLVAGLAAIDAPDVGFSPGLIGIAFAPVESSKHSGMHRPPEDICKWNAAFNALIELGPTALPFLLESLDDPTPTRLSFDHDSAGREVWLYHEVSANPFDWHEAKAMNCKTVDSQQCPEDGRPLDRYTLKVGDVCFVAIGQITNREYLAVRFHSAASTVVTSPIEDKALAAEVRAIWGKSNYRQKLFDSLLLDFRGYGNGEFQGTAATRLAYYFPDVAEDLIVSRLNELGTVAASTSQKADDVRLCRILKNVSWSSRPKLSATVLAIFQETNDMATLFAAMQGIGRQHDDVVFRRLSERLDALPRSGPRLRSDGYSLLFGLGERFPDRAEKAFRKYLEPGTVDRRRNVILVLRQTCGHLAVPLLTPLLEDTRDGGPRHWAEPSRILRVCDEAAETIAMNSKTLEFNTGEPRQDLDRQIEILRQRIAEQARSK